MQKYIKISKYHFGIIVIYLLATPILWLLMPQVFQYKFSWENIGKVITLIIISILGFFLYISLFKKKEIKINLTNFFSRIPLLIIYALFFAIPEEIIFRGIIQQFFQNHLVNIYQAILIASLIFGLVHLPNGAKGVKPKRWNWQFAIIALLGGLVFGGIFTLSGSLLIPTILHTFFLFFLLLKATH